MGGAVEVDGVWVEEAGEGLDLGVLVAVEGVGHCCSVC